MERVTSSCAEALLERAAPAIASGSVNVISVDAIRLRCQSKWERTRYQVEEFVERTFTRLASPSDMIVALNDLEYLTIQPDASRGAALNMSANVLKQTLTFFLGAAEPSDLKLLLVTGFAEGKISLEAVDLARLAAEEAEPGAPRCGTDEGTAAAAGLAAAPSAPVAWERTARLALRSDDDRRALHLELSLEPIWNVAARAVASFLVRERVLVEDGAGRRPVAAARLPATVAGEAAVKTLAHAVTLLTGGDNAVRVGLHVPVPLEALSYSSARYSLLHALKAVDPAVRARLMLEITNLPHGFPQGRMTEMVATLAPHCRAVLARAADETARLSSWRGCGLGGVSLDCSAIDPCDRNADTRLQAFAGAAGGAAPGCIAYSLGSNSLLMQAWATGFTHLGGRTVEAQVRTPAAQRLDPIQFYSPSIEARAI